MAGFRPEQYHPGSPVVRGHSRSGGTRGHHLDDTRWSPTYLGSSVTPFSQDGVVMSEAVLPIEHNDLRKETPNSKRRGLTFLSP
jgi:hypothetical protein